MLSEEQILALQQAEFFGWELRFIRQRFFREATAVLYSEEGERIGVLKSDGMIEANTGIKVRK